MCVWHISCDEDDMLGVRSHCVLGTCDDNTVVLRFRPWFGKCQECIPHNNFKMIWRYRHKLWWCVAVGVGTVVLTCVCSESGNWMSNICLLHCMREVSLYDMQLTMWCCECHSLSVISRCVSSVFGPRRTCGHHTLNMCAVRSVIWTHLMICLA